jgi:hypothetical protein
MKFHASKAATVLEMRAGGFDAAKPLCGESLAKAFSAEGLRTVPHAEGREHVNCAACLDRLR